MGEHVRILSIVETSVLSQTDLWNQRKRSKNPRSYPGWRGSAGRSVVQ